MITDVIPRALPHGRSHGERTTTTKSAVEARLRAEVSDAAFDAIPDARPKGGKVAGAPRSCARRPPRHREKVFGYGRPVPLDREAKNRIMVRAKALMKPVEKGKHWGAITAKALEVLKALLWTFHNVVTGKCFPSYEKIAEAAGVARSTVAEAIKMLEAAGLLTWVNRLAHIWEPVLDMFGQWTTRRRMIRTSNGYRFIDPHPSSKSELPSVTSNQDSSHEPLLFNGLTKIQPQADSSSLEHALAMLKTAVKMK
jgi:hypothetical protein